MFKELQDDFDKYIAYLKKVIDLQQEMVDKYVDMENRAANAVKEIYQKILDTKLEAIDREKEAIEDLRKAREQARKDQENAKAISGLQTNLQRTMMDTSGASDTAFIKAQKDIQDKLDDIAEDKYSQMLDDISEKLSDEQEALRQEFDEL
jgi:predicted transcriptional regulator